MIDKLKRLGFVIIILFISYFMSGVISKELFLNNTQIVRPNLTSYLAMRVNNITSPLSALVARLQGRDVQNTNQTEVTQEKRYENLGNVAFSQITKGVSAREKDGVSEARYEIKNIKWVEYSYKTRAGTTITIKIPEGQKPPPDGVL